MSARALPTKPSLENLRKQAKDLLKALRAGDPGAAARLAESHPRWASAGGLEAPRLADAQLVIAREHGLPSWPSLVHHVGLGAESRKLHRLHLLFQGLPDARGARRSLVEALEREVEALVDAHRAGLPAAATLLHMAGWQAGGPPEPEEALLAAELGVDGARLAIARWHRFASWDDVLRHADRAVDPAFEAAADAIVAGEVDTLRGLLAHDPALATARSPFGHHATLLHHVAANGVEESRQWQSPASAVEIARALLQAGADPDATCDCYGGGATTLALLVSSVHPARAGVQVALVDALIDAGAAVNGIDDDGAPLLTALAFGYPAAAEALVRRGARVDSIVAAAGLGRLDLVERCFGDDGRLRGDVLRPLPGVNVAADATAHLERALVWASMLGRTAVADFLLAKGVDPAARAEQGFTGLHWAAWRGDLATIAVLLARGAPLEAKNAYGGTVLDGTVWAALRAPVAGVDYPAVVDALLTAGADIEVLGPGPTGVAAIDVVLRRHRDGRKPSG